MDLEKKVIESALRIKNGNMTQAAAFLHIPRHVRRMPSTSPSTTWRCGILFR